MERSTTDRYLHKKFKKQLNIEPNIIQNNQNVKQEETPSSVSSLVSVVQHSQQEIRETNENSSNANIAVTSSISDDSVPKVSTNENTFINVTVLESSSSSSSNLAKSSISQEKNVNVVNVVSEERKSENNDDKAGEFFLNNPNSNNSCISYVISKSSRIENLNQPESDQYRVTNFDTTARFNISQQEEPIRNIPSADQSSILENVVYSKQYVTSKLVNVDKLGDISSSSSSNNDLHQHYHYHHQEEDNNNKNSTESNQTQQETVVEKSTGSSGGGKYICSYCNLACSKPSVLQKHIRAHTNERPYPCVSCGFSFKTRSNLYKHCRSRTHANRVMGNKAQEINNEVDTDSQSNKMDVNEQNETSGAEDVRISEETKGSITVQDNHMKTKPYKPRFHTAKAFFEDISKDNIVNQKDAEDQKVPETVQNSRPSNSDLLSLHINEVINKNNAIVNSSEPYLLRKRSLENLDNNNHHHNEVVYPQNINLEEQRQNPCDEPLNLTNKGRKRCLSEVAEPITSSSPMHTSLIKELLLKNLYADSMQCLHCKMIFQTVTELELHKMRSCKGYTKTGARYSRSSSVNVASILTKNKNAFDNIPHLQNTVFPLKSPGPFLGKTRLVEGDKTKSFSFDDGLPTFHNNDILRTTLRYSISPLTIQQDKVKKTPVKLFGGEVKIHLSGETKSFKIDAKDNNEHFTDFGGRLSENRVVKSSLQSGGTVLQNKPSYNPKQDSLTSSPDIIRVYNNTSLSPSIDITNLEKAKINFERQPTNELESEQHKTNSDLIVRPPADVIGSSNFSSTTPSASYKYTNIMDFSQKAVKLLAPNLKQPNLTIPGVPVPNKIVLSRSPSLAFEIKQEPPKTFDSLSVSRSQTEHERSIITTQPKNQEHAENIQFAQRQILLQQKMAGEPCIQSPNTCNPLNVVVNGKIIRYVPGMPGPIAADVSVDVPYRTPFRPQKPVVSSKPSVPIETQTPVDKPSESRITYNGPTERTSKSLEIKVSNESLSPIKSPSLKALVPIKTDNIKSPNQLTSNSNVNEPPRKFARPNTLALKPSIAAHKQHHGLTPTMFNQILISPDTPRVAKKYMQHFLHGNYFSYLGLKSSTKVVYCTLNKTQPTYVPHFKKLSMYSEWRQQDTKTDKLYVSAYDSRQRQQKYVTAGKATPDLIAHSSYKFIVTETSSTKGEENQKSNSILGGYESNEDYTYVRGRGRGRYVCDQCGIRCKKPSMLKKHIRTHTNDRPYTCSHCNFSFKTKGNLTKHMKSKAHTKNYAASSSSSSSSSTQQSGTQSSESDTDDSGMDSSDESTRQQEHEAAYGLLSLSQKTTPNMSSNSPTDSFSTNSSPICSLSINSVESAATSFMNNDQVTQVNNTNFAKNKILDQQITINFNASKIISETPSTSADSCSKEMQNLQQFLGKTNTNRPLTYPYTSDVVQDKEKNKSKDAVIVSPVTVSANAPNYESATHLSENTKIEQRFNIIQKHSSDVLSPKVVEKRVIPITISYDPSYLEQYKVHDEPTHVSPIKQHPPVVKINDRVVLNNVPYNSSMHNDIRKRKLQEVEVPSSTKIQRMNSESEAMDLSMPSLEEKTISPETNVLRYNGASPTKENEFRTHLIETRTLPHPDTVVRNTSRNLIVDKSNFIDENNYKLNGTPPYEVSEYNRESDNAINLKATSPQQSVDINYVIQENHPSTVITTFTEVPQSFSPMDYDNSAMETLADVATKQVKLEKNTLAKSVASEYLKLATKHEFQTNDGIRETNNFITATKDVNELIVKPEENKSCTICAKNFSKPSQLRLHMNIHYLERPFRCDPCSVSFRTKGHLQKHERSASHHNKLSSSPLLSSSEPRPFKCSDCNIAFRIHGHLAKHLRSKMHIMKLECLAKIPFGLYAELERANSLLTEINTTDGDQCLESLKALARKVFINDPSKLNQLEVSLSSTDTSDNS